MLDRIIQGWHDHCSVNGINKNTKRRDDHLIAYLNGAKMALLAVYPVESKEIQSFGFFCYMCAIRGESWLAETEAKLAA